MKNKVSLSGIGLGVIAFFLPWVSIECSGERMSKTGIDLAGSQGLLYVCLVVLACLILIYVLFRAKGELVSKKVFFIAGPIVNLIVLAAVYINGYANGIDTGMAGTISYADLGIRLEYGVFIFIGAQILALVGAFMLVEEVDTPKNNPWLDANRGQAEAGPKTEEAPKEEPKA